MYKALLALPFLLSTALALELDPRTEAWVFTQHMFGETRTVQYTCEGGLQSLFDYNACGYIIQSDLFRLGWDLHLENYEDAEIIPIRAWNEVNGGLMREYTFTSGPENYDLRIILVEDLVFLNWKATPRSMD